MAQNQILLLVLSALVVGLALTVGLRTLGDAAPSADASATTTERAG